MIGIQPWMLQATQGAQGMDEILASLRANNPANQQMQPTGAGMRLDTRSAPPVYDFGNNTYNPASAQTGAITGGNTNFGNYSAGGGMDLASMLGPLSSLLGGGDKKAPQPPPAFRAHQAMRFDPSKFMRGGGSSFGDIAQSRVGGLLDIYGRR